MEYAIVELGGHQMWVEEGQHFIMNRIKTNPGTNILFNRVLLVKKKGICYWLSVCKKCFYKR